MRTRILSLLLAVAMTLTFFAGVASATPSASQAFDKVWGEADKPVLDGQVTRSWMWGPNPIGSAYEPYEESPSGMRLVQYYDKSRMEITNPNGDPNNGWYVTNGLLVYEMMSGQIQVGDDKFFAFHPADVNVAGDLDKPGLYYSVLARFSTLFGNENRVEKDVDRSLNEWIINFKAVEAKPPVDVRNAIYVEETGHNVAEVFYNWMVSSQSGVQDNLTGSWVYPVGLPLSEAYWTWTYVGGELQPVLVQAFQRRVLTYTPNNPIGWQVENGNTGLQYTYWRASRVNTFPAWSPDGTKLAWEAWGINSEIVVWENGTTTQVTTSPVNEVRPVWIDNQTLAYTDPEGVKIENLASGEVRTIDAFQIVPSSDGSRTVTAQFTADGINILVDNVVVVTGLQYLADMEWSPDQTKIAFMQDSLGGSRSVSVVNLQTGQTNLVYLGRDMDWPRKIQWTPNSSELGIETLEGKVCFFSEEVIRCMRQTMGDFSVSRFGQIAYADENGLIWVSDLNGDGAHAVTSTAGGWDLTWNPSGDSIAFNRYGKIFIANLDGSEVLVGPRPQP